MQVRNGLAGGRAIVDAYVVAIGPVLPGRQRFDTVEKGKKCRALDASCLKERADMALGHHQAMPRGHRIGIQNQHRICVLLNDAAGGEVAKRTRAGRA